MPLVDPRASPARLGSIHPAGARGRAVLGRRGRRPRAADPSGGPTWRPPPGSSGPGATPALLAPDRRGPMRGSSPTWCLTAWPGSHSPRRACDTPIDIRTDEVCPHPRSIDRTSRPPRLRADPGRSGGGRGGAASGGPGRSRLPTRSSVPRGARGWPERPPGGCGSGGSGRDWATRSWRSSIDGADAARGRDPLPRRTGARGPGGRGAGRGTGPSGASLPPGSGTQRARAIEAEALVDLARAPTLRTAEILLEQAQGALAGEVRRLIAAGRR